MLFVIERHHCAMQQYFIVGLGNVGDAYMLTRHNVGFMVVDYLAQDRAVAWQAGHSGDVATCRYRGRMLHLLKPDTYMNHSGRAVCHWLRHLKLPVEQCLVVVDDIAFPLGKLRMRTRGSAAGHNGLKSIEEHLATRSYPRLRIGIGNDFQRGHQDNYVLSPFTGEEQMLLSELAHRACQMIYTFCTLGASRVMSQYHGADTSVTFNE